MLTIYHLEQSRSERIIWLCEELGLHYALVPFRRTDDFLPPPEFYAIHPLARAPVIADGETMLIESGAIIEYLIERYGDGRLKPDTASLDYPRYLQFLHFAEGTAMADFVTAWNARRRQGEAKDVLSETIGSRVGRDLAYLEISLNGVPYFGGTSFSGADIAIAFFIRSARDSGMFATEPYPNLCDYLRRIEARPAYQKASDLAKQLGSAG